MSLVIPSWVAHMSTDDSDDKDKKKPTTIFSLNVHPDGTRLATGGIDQKIRIWATEPILDEKAETAVGTHRLLSTLSRHSGSVVSLRFSPSGKYLASGSDDTVCLIWEFDPSGAGSGGGGFGSFGSSEQNIESWRVHRRLTGHESDVVDIAWSADGDDSYLATVGLDATVNIWGGPAENFDRIKTIRAHDGFVKGVVWDPRGQYLATQSDDKTLKIWRTADWSCAHVVQSPFVNSPTSNFFGRLSWSPDGAHIVAANAMNGPVFVASVIDRDTWSSELKLVGHEDSVVVTAFSPRLFRNAGDKADALPAAIVALGSRDQTVSIWVTGNTRPLIVLKDVFERQVTDLSWSRDGLTLYASSTAGSVAVVALDRKMFAEVLPLNAVTFSRPNVGRGRATIATASSALSLGGTAQRPNILQPRKRGAAIPPATSSSGSMPPPAGTLPSPRPIQGSSGGRLNQQIEILANGKRRIRPTLLGGNDSSSAMDVDVVPQERHQQQYVHAVPAATSSSAPGISTEQLLQVLSQLPALQQPAQQQPVAQPAPPPQDAIRTSELPALITALKDLAGPSTTYANTLTHESFDAALKLVRQSKARAREGRVIGGDVHFSGNAGALVKAGVDAGAASSSSHGHVSDAWALTPPPVQGVLRRRGEDGHVEVHNYAESGGDGGEGEGGEGDATSSSSSRPSELRVYDDSSRLLWMDFIPSAVTRCALSLGYLAVALRDGTVQVYTARGRLVSRLSLDSPACFLECKGAVLLVITCGGLLHRWNLQDDAEMHRPISCLNLLKSRDDVHQVYLHSNGAPILVLRASEQAWTVDARRKNAWVCVADGWYSLGSEVWDGRARGRGEEATASAASADDTAAAAADAHSITSVNGDVGRWREPVKTIESEINSLLVGGAASSSSSSTSPRKRPRPPTDDAARTAEFAVTSTLRHMETRLQAAVLLSSRDEYTTFLRAYARKIANENLKGLGEELVRELLGPVYASVSTATATKWEPTLFDGTVSKRVLVKEVLGILKRSRTLEGMAQVYLDLIKSMGGV